MAVAIGTSAPGRASVRLYGIRCGIIETDRQGRISFRYEPGWIDAYAASQSGRHPLSLSLPVRPDIFEPEQASPFFDGLLPDNPQVRRLLARELQVSEASNFGLLFGLGRDCPGAVSILPEEEPEVDERYLETDAEEIDEAGLARMIRELPARPLMVDVDREIRLSLPGVHDKAALVRLATNRFALPRHQTPSTHILKVDIRDLPNSILVEHFCLRLADSLGLETPKSEIRKAEDRIYMLIRRYDRKVAERNGGWQIRRLHQEDFCQAAGRFSAEKYEKEGGPGWADLFRLSLSFENPATDRLGLLQRAIFQFLCGNPDAHAKNYAILYDNGLKLSPLYDVNNAAAFRSHFTSQRARLAMSVGGERNPEALTPDHWRAFARQASLAPRMVLGELEEMAYALPELASNLRDVARGGLEDAPELDAAVSDMTQRCEYVLRQLRTGRQ